MTEGLIETCLHGDLIGGWITSDRVRAYFGVYFSCSVCIDLPTVPLLLGKLLMGVKVCWVLGCLGAATFLTKFMDDFFWMLLGFSSIGLLYTRIFLYYSYLTSRF
jgi:hypothetical protein